MLKAICATSLNALAARLFRATCPPWEAGTGRNEFSRQRKRPTSPRATSSPSTFPVRSNRMVLLVVETSSLTVVGGAGDTSGILGRSQIGLSVANAIGAALAEQLVHSTSDRLLGEDGGHARNA